MAHFRQHYLEEKTRNGILSTLSGGGEVVRASEVFDLKPTRSLAKSLRRKARKVEPPDGLP